MLTLAEVREWLKSFKLFDNYYIGRIDKNKKNVLGVYNLNGTPRREVIGDLKAYEVKGISLLIHGNTNKADTEEKAHELYNELENIIMACEYESIGDNEIYFIELLQNEPVDVDQDENNIYEYVIELNFYYKK